MTVAAAPGVEVCTTCLARFACVDPSCLDALALPATLAALAAAEHAARAMEAARPAVEDALHAVVGTLDDRRLRRAALRMRRDAHNGRGCRVPAEVVAELAERMPPAACDALRAWREASAAGESALERAAARLDGELQDATTALERELSAHELRRGIAMASPDFHDELARGRRRIAPGAKPARTALSYLSRAAVKTSPFSTLTTVGWAHVGPIAGERAPLRPEAARRHRVGASLTLAVELLAACARDEILAGAFDFEANPTIGADERALVGTRLAVDGFAWRREEIVDLAALGDLAALLRDAGRGPAATWRAALGGEDPQTAFARMLDLDLVRPVAPWTPGQEPIVGLAGALAALADPRAQEMAAGLGELAAELAALPWADGARRAAAQRALSRSARGWIAALADPVADAPGDAGAAYEDVVEDGVVALGEHVREDLATVAADLWPRVVRSRLYDELLAAFVERYGPGGRCRDVLAFLLGFLAADSGRERGDRAIDADLRANGGGDGPSSGLASTAPPAAMIRFQLAAASHADVLAGRYRLVVNQCSQGAGGLLARFAVPEGGPAAVAASAALRSWAAGLAPGADVVHVGFASDWSGLQAVAPQVAPELAWPGNLPARLGRARRLDLLELCHEPGADGLVLRGRDGRRVVPIYLGTVPSYLVGGPARLLMALGDPWILRWSRPGGEDRVAPGDVVVSERRRAGRVVLSRRRWRVAPTDLPLLRAGETELELLRRAHRWRREHGIPVEVFATAQHARPSFDARARKPRWLRFDSLHALRAAEGLLGPGVTAIELSEALPGRDEHWLRAADGSARAAEFVALVRWPAAFAEAAA